MLLCIAVNLSATTVAIQECSGWFESGYVTWTVDATVSNYHVYCRPAGGTYTQLDAALVRNYGTYGRADVLGISAGNYQFKVVPVDATDTEITADAAESATFTATAHDRSGFAHYNYASGIGAYNNDGTLKSGAQVFYITASNAKTITATIDGASCTGLQAMITYRQKNLSTTPLCFRIIGTIEADDMDAFGSSEEGLQIKGKAAHSEMNITIEGVGNDATIRGFGMLIRNCTSVEIRNLGIMLYMDDGLSFDTDNSHCWAHNIDFFYGKTGSAADQVKGDGSLDCKANSQYMTFSYNHFWDSGKMALCGMKNSESGENFITYHHNWFDHSDSRHPRVRTMTVHVYNNYFDGNSKYGVGATTGANVFVESNYFRNTNKPMMISLQGTDIYNGSVGTFSSESGGMIKSYGNTFAECSSSFRYVPHTSSATNFDAYEATTRDEIVPASYVTLSGGTSYNNFDTDATKMYTYTADASANIPGIVTGTLGAGRMQHGDFTWTFTNSTDDSSSDLNTALKTAITDYQSSLVSIFGGDSIIGGGTGSGDDGSGDGGAVGTGGGYECYFTGGAASSDFYSITGNYSDSKGSVTLDATEYTWCLKMEGSTEISFTTTEDLTLYLVFGGSTSAAGKRVKIDDVNYTTTASGSNYIVTLPITAGAHTIKKTDSINLFYINMTGGASSGINDVATDKEDGIMYDLMGRKINAPAKGQIYIQNGKKYMMTY